MSDPISREMMSLSADARAELTAQQAALVAALVAHGQTPAGFDTERLRAAATSLRRKRSRATARAWPGLARSMGPRFGALFKVYAESAPLTGGGAPLADGRAFARWLATRGELPQAGQLEALAVDLRYVCNSKGIIPRRWPACKIAWLRQSRRLIAALRLPWFGERWLTIPLGRAASPR